MECCRLPPSPPLPLLLPSNRSHVFLRALLPCTLVTWRRLPLRHALFPIALRSARGHRLRCPRFAAEGVFIQDSVSPARPGRRATPPLHSAPPTDRPTDRPTEGGAAFSASSTRPLACSCRSFLVSCHPRVKCFKKRARPPPPRPQADIHSLRARSHGGRRGGGAAALPPGWLPLPGLLVLVVISIGRRSGRGERRQCAATPISQSRRIDWAIEEEEERQRRSYLLEDEEAFEVFEVGDRY